MSSTDVKVDDADPGIHYSGTWITSGDIDPTQEFMQTTHGTVVNGSSFTYTFTGTLVSVTGVLPPVGSNANNTLTLFDVDGIASFGGDPRTSFDFYGFTYYESPELSSGEHTLTVTVVSIDSVDPRPFWFDFLSYTPVAPDVSRRALLPDAAPPAAVPPTLRAPQTPPTLRRTAPASDGRAAACAGAAAALVPMCVAGLVLAALWWLHTRFRRRLARARAQRMEGDEKGVVVPERAMSTSAERISLL